MKKPKGIGKVAAIALSIALTIGNFSFVKAEVVTGTNEPINVTIGDAAGKPGDEITVPVSLSNVPVEGINNFNFDLQFNNDKLELEGVDPGELITNPTEDFAYNKYDPQYVVKENEIQFFFCDETADSSRAIKKDGTIANIKFRIKDISDTVLGAAGITTVIHDTLYGDNRAAAFGVNAPNDSIVNKPFAFKQGVVTISPSVLPIDLQNMQADEAAITFGDITDNIVLPLTGAHGSRITWSSSNTAVISNTGVVVRPQAGQSDALVTLTAVFTNGTATGSKQYNVTVKALSSQPMSDLEAVATDKDAISIPGIEGAAITENIVLPTVGQNGTIIGWTSDNSAIVIVSGTVTGTATGVVTRPAAGQPDAQVTLTATITKGDAKDTRSFGVTVQAQTQDQVNGVQVTIGTAEDVAGAEVTVPVTFQNVPSSGISAAYFKIKYDPTVLTAESITADNGIVKNPTTDFAPMSSIDSTKGVITVGYSDMSQDGSGVIKTNGTFANIKFLINASAAVKSYDVLKLNDPNEGFSDNNLNVINVTFVNGSITVVETKYGDVNGDSKINTTDIQVIQRSLTNRLTSTTKFVRDAADVNKDNKVNTTDIQIIQRYLTGRGGVNKLPYIPIN